MIPEIPESLTAEELRALYRAESGSCAAYGLAADDPEGWERVRKYAYARYWNEWMDSKRAVSRDEIEEWERFVALPFLRNVGWGVVGDAARRDLLSADALQRLRGLSDINDYAARQLRARSLLSASSRVDAALVEGLLESHTPWGFHELLSRKLDPEELRILEAATADKRISRAERHSLREALRTRGAR